MYSICILMKLHVCYLTCNSDSEVMLNDSLLCADVSEGLEQNQTVTVLQAQEYHAAPLCDQCVSCVCAGAVSVFG